MGELQPPVSTHQSWTGSVAAYIAKPPRAALYTGQAGAAAATGAPDLANAGVTAGSQPPQPQSAPPAAVAARQQPVLPSAPNKASLRGTWLLSKGSATLTAALSAEGRGEFTVQVQLQGTTLWVQNLFDGGGQVRLLAPTLRQEPGQMGTSKAVGGGGGGAEAAADAKIPSGATAAAFGTRQPWLLLLLPRGSAQADVGTVAAASLWPEPQPHPKQPQPKQPQPKQPQQPEPDSEENTAVKPPQPFSSSPPPSLCFRFNSPAEGRAFQSLMRSAERVKEAVVRRAEERRQEADQRQAEKAERLRLRVQACEQQRQQQQNLQVLSIEQQAARVVGDGQVEGRQSGLARASSVASRGLSGRLSDADIQAAIERYLLEPGFQALVDRVEAVWEEMEEQAERQLQAADAAAAAHDQQGDAEQGAVASATAGR